MATKVSIVLKNGEGTVEAFSHCRSMFDLQDVLANQETTDLSLLFKDGKGGAVVVPYQNVSWIHFEFEE